jgi:hypothetical protein
MTSRLKRHAIGPKQKHDVEHVMRELCRHIREKGRAPRIDADDPMLQHAWIKLVRQMERNAGARRRAA